MIKHFLRMTVLLFFYNTYIRAVNRQLISDIDISAIRKFEISKKKNERYIDAASGVDISAIANGFDISAIRHIIMFLGITNNNSCSTYFCKSR